MERPEHGGLSKRPELDEENPAALFEFAKARILWNESRLSPQQLDESLLVLSEQLQHYVEERYDEMPRVIVRSRDITHTDSMTVDNGEYRIKTGPKPFTGDAAVFAEHTVEGQLCFFHQGVNGDIRIYVRNDAPPQMTPGGYYTPLLSVGVVNSHIEFEQYANRDKMLELEERIVEAMDGAPSVAMERINLLMIEFADDRTHMLRKLVTAAETIEHLEATKVLTQQAIDSLFDYVRVQLSLDTPHDIGANMYRHRVDDGPIPHFIPKGRATFENCIPQLAIVGESKARMVALTFMDEDRVIQVPVRHINRLIPVKQQQE